MNIINKQELDRHITGNYGEDQFKQIEIDPELLAKEMWEVWIKKYGEVYSEIYTESSPLKLPEWKSMDEDIKQCWIAIAKHVIDEHIN